MPIKYLAVFPHGDSINPFKWSFKNVKTKKSLFLLKRMFCLKDIDLTLIISPHAEFIENSITINCSNKLVGETAGVNFDFFGDATIYNMLNKESFKKFNIKVVMNNIQYVDWGTLIPALYTTIYQKNKKMCFIAIDPRINKEEIKEFGYKLAEELEGQNKNIGIIISCDQSHAHKNSPYGTSKFGEIIDFKIKDLILRNRLDKISLLSQTKAFKEANMDCLIPFLFLSGILKFNKFKSVFLSYERGELLDQPELKDYFGMITCYFSKDNI